MLINEENLIYQIRNDKYKRNDIAILYYLCLDMQNINWEKVNKEIIDRWSLSGLKYIKKEAWIMFNLYEQRKNEFGV